MTDVPDDIDDFYDEGEDLARDVVQTMEWGGDHVDIEDALRQRGAAYGEYVNTERHIPTIHDGLKPVQRRILFGMSELKLTYNRSFAKCAKITGDVMGNYHPHGDSSIYAAMVRMGQDFTVSVPMVFPQGNFGSIDGDPPAAYRYTEAKLTEIASSCQADLRPEIVPYQATFDDKLIEPVVIPMTFPNLLVNGNEGIGWGISSNIPPHNLGEAIEACLLIADNPDATIKQIMKRMPGPDYPTGGIIVNPDVLENVYVTGRGSTSKLQGQYHVEQVGNAQAMVITALPHGVGPTAQFEKIRLAASKEQITELAGAPTNLSGKEGTKLVLKVKRGGDINRLISQVMMYTDMQVSKKLNFMVLKDGVPTTVGVPEMLTAFVSFRRDVVTKRHEFERKGLIKDLLRLSAIRSALDVIDAVVKIIRNAKDDDESRAKLVKILKVIPYGETKAQPITMEQADMILAMQLRRLTKLNQFQIDEEIATKTARATEIDAVLSDEGKVNDIVKSELRQIKKQFAVPRATVLASDVVAGTTDDGKKAPIMAAIPKTDVRLTISASGQAIAVERTPKSPVTGSLNLRAEDHLAAVLDVDTSQDVLVFTNQGMCLRRRVDSIGVSSRKSQGSTMVDLASDERIVHVQPYADDLDVLLVTDNGNVKRLDPTVLTSGVDEPVIALSNERVVDVVVTSGDHQLLVHTALGKVLRTPVAAIRPVKTGSAGPVALMKLQVGDWIVRASAVYDDDPGEMIVLHEGGHAKRVKLADYPSKGRNGGGVQSAATDKPAKDPAGVISTFLLVPDGSAAMELITDAGGTVAAKAGSCAAGARAAVSKAWLALAPGDRVNAKLSEARLRSRS